jgi:uncharacterized protein (DUF2336 family)
MAHSPADVLVELEEAVAACPPERCGRVLSGLVNLLATSHGRSQPLLAEMVDGVLLHLTGRVAPAALVQLGHRLAMLNVAPLNTLRRLASHENPEVASAVLLKSRALSIADLEAVATSCGEPHRLAIAARGTVEPAVTEALIKSGSRTVALALIGNAGAQFSDAAYAALVETGATDDELAKALALRPDTPDLVLRRLLSPSRGQTAAKAQQPPGTAAYADARPEIVALNRVGKLNDSTVNRFAIRGETANLFAALSVLSGAPTEIIAHVMADEDSEGLVMACRASRLNWPTTLAILSNRGGLRLSFAERQRAQQIFETHLLSTSQWNVRWGDIAGKLEG